MLHLVNLTLFFFWQMNFSRGAGGCLSYMWKIQRGGGGVAVAIKMENPGRWGGPQEKFPLPSVVGLWIFSGTTHFEKG